jgi:hypothetical protein
LQLEPGDMRQVHDGRAVNADEGVAEIAFELRHRAADRMRLPPDVQA